MQIFFLRHLKFDFFLIQQRPEKISKVLKKENYWINKKRSFFSQQKYLFSFFEICDNGLIRKDKLLKQLNLCTLGRLLQRKG